MRRRQDLLDKLSREGAVEPDGSSGEDKKTAHRLLCGMFQYYKLNDLETGEQHSRIFKALYMERSERTYDEIAAAFHIHPYTLDRYRQRYNKLAKKLLEKSKTKELTIEKSSKKEKER